MKYLQEYNSLLAGVVYIKKLFMLLNELNI